MIDKKLTQLKLILVFYLILLAFVFDVVASNQPAFSQAAGIFSPSVYGDTAREPLPIRLNLPVGLPPLVRHALQLNADLEQARRPYVGHVFSFSNEPLGNVNNRLATVSDGVQFGFFPSRQTEVQFNFLPTILGLNAPRINAYQYILKVNGQPFDRFRYSSSFGLVQIFNNVQPGVSIIGSAVGSYKLCDRITLNTGYSREMIGNTRLSTVGLNLPGSGDLVGRILRNRFIFGTNIRPTAKTDISFQYNIGFDAGYRVITNPFNQFNLRVGQTLIGREPGSHLQFLQPNYQLLTMAFRRDLSGFGNASLSAGPTIPINIDILKSAQAGFANLPTLPGANNPSVGGYFSPQLFYMNTLRLDAGGRIAGPLYYQIGGGVGTQNVKNSTQKLNWTQLIGVFNASISARLGRHITVEQGCYFLQAAKTYQWYVIYNQLRYYF